MQIQSDGVRFAWIRTPSAGPRVFDTLRRRSFRPAAPTRGCRVGDIGGGFALWHSPSAPRALIGNLATGSTGEPAGIERVEAMESEHSFCHAQDNIGRYWLEFQCRGTLGPPSDPFYLNHRTGRLTEEFTRGPSRDSPLVDLDHRGLVRTACTPLKRRPIGAYAPPFALLWSVGAPLEVDRIRLRRCGGKGAEILSRCLSDDCQTPQLGSRYVTWAEGRRVFAYLPRIRRRVLVGRQPAELRGPQRPSVAHTCKRVFAQWEDSVYVARFEPREGAPRCQT